VFGLSLSVASTVVLLRALEARNSVNTHEGRVAVGWLVVEDLFMVVALVLLPPLARSLGGSEATPDESLFKLIAQTLLQISGFVAFMLLIGKKLFPAILTHVARTGSRELFTLSVVAAALGIAYAAAKVFGVSFALGAFFAGVVLRESHLSHRAAEQTLPLRDAFSVLFFASVGMLFDPRVLMTHPAETLAVVGVIMIGKSIAAMGLVLALRYPLSIALTVAASLAQIGEFSFILGGVGMHLGLLSPLAHNLILAGAILSIALNPLLFKFNDWVIAKSADNHHLQRIKNRWGDPLATIPEDTPAEGLRQQVIVAGYGRIGRRVASRLRENQVDVIVIDQNRELIEKLRQQGLQAVAGDATEPGTLIQAHVAHASMLVLTMPDIVGIARIIDTAVALQPAIRVIVRSHGRDESSLFENQPAVTVISSENALADQIAAAVLPPANSL
jgi:CPA2 family monovalent cation:H+ antiporter-2